MTSTNSGKKSKQTTPQGKPSRGISVADVLGVFPGARVISETKPAAQGPRQLRLIQGGKR
jgi:hypothetical protein